MRRRRCATPRRSSPRRRTGGRHCPIDRRSRSAPARTRRSLTLPSTMAPQERLVPRFAAEPPQDELPYGRWEQRLSEEFLAAALRLEDEPEDLGEPGAIAWYPDRTWHGHTYVPGTARTSGGYELFGYVRFLPATDDREPR